MGGGLSWEELILKNGPGQDGPFLTRLLAPSLGGTHNGRTLFSVGVSVTGPRTVVIVCGFGLQTSPTTTTEVSGSQLFRVPLRSSFRNESSSTDVPWRYLHGLWIVLEPIKLLTDRITYSGLHSYNSSGPSQSRRDVVESPDKDCHLHRPLNALPPWSTVKGISIWVSYIYFEVIFREETPTVSTYPGITRKIG